MQAGTKRFFLTEKGVPDRLYSLNNLNHLQYNTRIINLSLHIHLNIYYTLQPTFKIF